MFGNIKRIILLNPKSMEQVPQDENVDNLNLYLGSKPKEPLTSVPAHLKAQRTMAIESEDSPHLEPNLASSCPIKPPVLWAFIEPLSLLKLLALGLASCVFGALSVGLVHD